MKHTCNLCRCGITLMSAALACAIVGSLSERATAASEKNVLERLAEMGVEFSGSNVFKHRFTLEVGRYLAEVNVDGSFLLMQRPYDRTEEFVHFGQDEFHVVLPSGPTSHNIEEFTYWGEGTIDVLDANSNGVRLTATAGDFIELEIALTAWGAAPSGVKFDIKQYFTELNGYQTVRIMAAAQPSDIDQLDLPDINDISPVPPQPAPDCGCSTPQGYFPYGCTQWDCEYGNPCTVEVSQAVAGIADDEVEAEEASGNCRHGNGSPVVVTAFLAISAIGAASRRRRRDTC